jgi:hypothetical protein
MARGAYITTATLFALFFLYVLLANIFKRLKKPNALNQIYPLVFLSLACFVLSLPFSLAALILTHQDIIFEAISTYWFIIPALLAGPLLYLFRSRRPFFYGVVELVASWAIILVAIKVSNASTTNFPEGFPLLAKSTAILGGIYVSVRGFDNMDKKIPSKFARQWNVLFHGNRAIISSGESTT